MRRSKLTTSDRLIGASAIALVICASLPWFGFEKEFSQHGWNYPVWGVLPAVLGMAMLAFVIIGLMTHRKPAAGAAAAIVAVAGVVAPLLIVGKLVIGGKVHSIVGSVSLQPKFGIYLALAAAVGLAIGGVLLARETNVAHRA